MTLRPLTPEDIANALGRVTQKSNGGFMCQCPCHADDKASLSIDSGEKGLLVKCFAGCLQTDIISTLKSKGLWPEVAPREKKKVLTRYDYGDYTKTRFEGKTFGFSHRKAGKWIFTRGCAPLPYRLKDIQQSGGFCIVEGEKDADNLAAIGIPATTLDAGADSPIAPKLIEAATGKEIVLIPDNDPPGRKYADRIGAALVSVATSVKILLVPGLAEKQDVSDWLKIPGNGKEQLLELIRSAPEWTPAVITPPCEEWPEPVLFGEIETPDIPTTLLPEPLAAYCNALVESTQTPPGMAVMMGLSAVSACIQKRFEVCPFGDNYTEPVNLMTVTALDPASRKSAVVSSMILPLTTWETEQAEALKEQSARARHQRDMVIKSIDSIKAKASKPDSTDNDRREALAEVRRLEISMPPEIITPRLWIDDVTPERLQGLMADNGERIAVISAEGGIFEVIAGLYNGGKSNINVILQSHAGEPVRVERQGRSVTMLKPALTFGLTVQPSIIADLATGNKARFRGNGMLARLLYCIPKSTVGSRDVTRHRPVPESIKAEYHAMIYRLLAVNPLADESGRERPRLLTLAPEALKAWLTFSQYIESNQGQYGDFHSIQDWTGKLPGAALRIAGLCHVVENGDKTTAISRETIEKVLDLAELLIVHAKAAFAMMGSDPAIPDAKFILQWIIRNGADSFRRGDLHKALHGKFQRVDRLIKALQVLSERHIISEPQDRPTGRRPEIIYTVNPAILKGSCYGLA